MKFKTALLGAAAAFALAPAAYADRGSDGHVNVIYWQAPSIMNPYLSGGTKDLEAASLVLEPLAGFDEKGAVFARLAVDVPTLENGGVSKDLTTITWKLKPGILWSDGTPVTSADVKFTYDYCKAPDGGCAQASKYEGIKSVDTPDAMTIVVTFDAPKPNYNFNPAAGTWGAFELAARHSDLDLNYHDCGAGKAIPAVGVACFDAVRGGEQKISTIGLNWYLNPDIRLMFDWQHVDVNRFNAAGLQVGQKYDAIAMRSQLSF